MSTVIQEAFEAAPTPRSSTTTAEDPTSTLLRPMAPPSWRTGVLVIAATAGLFWFASAWAFQLRHGLVVTGLGDWGTGHGVTWGFYVGSFIWWVGIAHGGIIVSAAVRLFGLDSLKPVARLAELLTLAALAVAGLYIILHVGRPERIVTSILPNLPDRIGSSPLAWDVTVITLYFTMTATYVLLTIRHDLYSLRDRLPKRLSPLYRAVLVGHQPGEREKVERMAWWLALAVIIIAPLFLHGGVIPWLFALLPGTPGWFGPIQGPQFLAAALTSALGGVTLLAAIFRRAYRWEELIDDRVFVTLSRWMGLFALLYLWLQLQQVVTGSAMAPEAVRDSVAAKTSAPLYWLALALLGAAVVHAGVQALSPRHFSVRRTTLVAGLPVVAILIEKTLFVVEGTLHPAFTLYHEMKATYTPSWVELSSLVGAAAIVTLFFVAASRIVPLMEIEEVGP
ncbi:MAG: NrfD/PsrC family molybdoenzyme membrane anchor subunit [Nitriliruptorales bacterium]|nr:NrfD/PsrC family molybdoenzyme membrane anchor subunit [Nitriliruptorales bacterium]